MFDAYPLAGNMGLFEVVREAEFAPIKNAPGSNEDSPDTARALVSNLHYSWLRKAGVEIEGAPSSESNKLCEISPLLSYEGEELETIAE